MKKLKIFSFLAEEYRTVITSNKLLYVCVCVCAYVWVGVWGVCVSFQVEYNSLFGATTTSIKTLSILGPIVTLSITILSIMFYWLCWVSYVLLSWRVVEVVIQCRYTECLYAECRGTPSLLQLFSEFSFLGCSCWQRTYFTKKLKDAKANKLECFPTWKPFWCRLKDVWKASFISGFNIIFLSFKNTLAYSC